MSAVFHHSWASHYDTISRLSFEDFYEDFTEFTLIQLLRILPEAARVLDVGCGTGRIALPLALNGFSVTGIDASAPMLSQLQQKADLLECALEALPTPVQDFQADAPFDAALCLFTVISYLTDDAALTAAFRAMASALKPGGVLLLDCPRQELFHSFQVATPQLARQMRFQSAGPRLYEFTDSGTLHLGEQVFTFEEHFQIRYWPLEEVQAQLEACGFALEETFPEASDSYGSDYLLLRKVTEW